MKEAEKMIDSKKHYSKRFHRPWFVEWTLSEDLELIDGETPETFGPECKTSGSAGYDLKALEDCTINPGQLLPLVRTGIKMKIPFGYVGLLSPRSGLGTKGLSITNTPGIIDSDYRGEIKANLVNLGTEPISWKRGERIVQICFTPIKKGLRYMPEGLSEDKFNNERKDKGYGSTGMKNAVVEEKSKTGAENETVKTDD